MSSHAEDAVRAVYDSDPTAQTLGMTLGRVSPGRVELSCPVGEQMVNSLGLVHGGYLFLLADTAFAYCCVSVERVSPTRTAEIAFLAPSSGRALHAVAMVKQQSGRTTICDVTISDDNGMPVAEFRGHGALFVARPTS